MADWIDQHTDLGEHEADVREWLARCEDEQIVARLWAQDAGLWSDDRDVQAKIRNRLGWLVSPLMMQARIDELDCMKDAPYADAVLLGMGGSSLAPEVFQRVFGNAEGAPRLHVLDNTTASAVQQLRDAIDPTQTLFLSASKSGTTVETRSFTDYFFEQSGRVGKGFVAITDPGSRMFDDAAERDYAALFVNPQDIGGRYSVLSFFGLVPATVIGLDVAKLLERTAAEIRGSSAAVPPAQNAALVLGLVLGVLGARGRDKLTLLASPTLEPFGDWAEQLIAESTGKSGVGVLPIVGERPAAPDAYGDDRLFVYLRLAGEGAHDDLVERLKGAGHPVVQVDLDDPYDLGAQFFRWEFATAVAGIVLGINPFDEPNVTESKNNTKRLLKQVQEGGELPEPEATIETDEVVVSGVAGESPEAALRTFADDTGPNEYVAIMAYVPMTGENEAALRDLQAAMRDRSGAATTLGFGPRFLHSTGQFHKGGPAIGRFIQIVADDPADVAIPGAPYDFDTLARAQALGDLEALQSRAFPTLRLRLRGDVPTIVERLASALQA